MKMTDQPPGSEQRELFLKALEKRTPAERAAFLDGACGDDLDLRASIEVLLAHHHDDSFLEESPAGLAPTDPAGPAMGNPPEEAVDARIGRYKLLQRIGEGGCGVVYMAEQEEPVRRRVALKVIKLGMDTKSVIARFEAERQALALMDHPNIARVLDAGATETGRPYFVMELVRGIKITEYCDQEHLPTRERLDLFIKVCQAIQHAHQKGIIHRDIKPSNILVTLHDGVPVPKVIDFGIAKATTDQRLTDKTLFTALEQFIGTPAYMSPEQAEMSGLDVDTRCDIYSLGVLLYELLTGKTPFDAKELLASGLDAMRRTIREEEPMRPSTKLSMTLVEANVDSLKSPTTGKAATEQEERADSRRLLRMKEAIPLLRGDVDWIVMKCLEKDRARRYETANGLATDIRRHMNNEAVTARPPSAAYRARKFVLRNKLVVAAVASILIVLVVGATVSAWQAVRATRSAKLAKKAQENETKQRLSAEEARREAEARAYTSDMNLALQAWEEGDFPRATNLIETSRPARGQVPPFEWRYLQKLCRDQSIVTFGGPNDEYGSCLFIGANSLLLSHGKLLKLYDLANQKERVLIEDPDGFGRLAACPANTNLLAAATDDGRIKIWDLTARVVLVVFEGHPNSFVRALNFSPDGRLLSSTGCYYTSQKDTSVKLWDVALRNPKPIHTLHRYSYGGLGVVFSPDGKQLFSSGTENVIRIWDCATGREAAAPLKGHTSWIGPLVLSPDGLSMVSTSSGRTKVWNVGSGQFERELPGNSTAVDALAFSPDGRVLATGARDRTIRLWDYQSGQQLALLCGHAKNLLQLSYSPDGRWLASRSKDGVVKVWNSASALDGGVLRGASTGREDLAISPDGHRLACVGVSSVVNLWDLEKGSRTDLEGHGSETVAGVAFSPNGRMLATGSHDRTVRLWDVNDHKPLGVLTNGFPVGSLAFSPDGRTLIAGGSSLYFLEGDLGGLQFWDVSSQQATGTIADDSSDIVELALSPNGAVLATGHTNGVVKLWDARSRGLLHRFPSQFGEQVMSLAFSPAEPLLAGSDKEGNIVIYNFKTMEVVGPPLKAHTFVVWSLAFSPDGQTLAAAGEGGGLKLWNVASRQLAMTLKGHVGSVAGIAFSQDGNMLASCGLDSTVRIWLAAPLQQVSEPK